MAAKGHAPKQAEKDVISANEMMENSTCKFDIFPVSHIHIIHVLRQRMSIVAALNTPHATSQDRRSF